MAELSALYGESWTLPNVKENTLALLRYFNIQVQENIEATIDQDPESAADEDPESSDQGPGGEPVEDSQRVSVKRRKKDLGLYERVPSTYPVINRYKETGERRDKNARSCENSRKRLGQMFAHALKKPPDKSPWMLLVDFHVFWEYPEESRVKCGTLPATLLTTQRTWFASAYTPASGGRGIRSCRGRRVTCSTCKRPMSSGRIN